MVYSGRFLRSVRFPFNSHSIISKHQQTIDPLCGEDDAAQRLEIVGELDVPQPGFRMQQAGDNQVDDLMQATAVRWGAGHLVERGQRFHHVHVHVERLAIPAVFSASLSPPKL